MTATAEKEAPKKAKTLQEKNAALNADVKTAKERKAEAKKYFDKANISSVKMINGKILVHYETMEENATTVHDVSSSDTPSESFSEAFNALRIFVAEIVFMDKKEREYQAPRLAIKSVNFKEFDEGNLHAGIGSTLTLPNGKTTALNIPQMPLYPESEHVAGHTKECAERVEAVLEETRKFLAGHRVNGTLF